MGIFQNLSDDDINEFVDEFIKVNFGNDDDDDPGSYLFSPEFKLCPKCKLKLEKKTSISFNGDVFDVLKCTKCGYCE
jgi:hypothetical protein